MADHKVHVTLAWRRYAEMSDQPIWFTRWMLERTLALLDVASTREDVATYVQVSETLRDALKTTPLAPPAPVDPKVDMLRVGLTLEQARAVVSLFEENAGSKDAHSRGPKLCVDLDASQRKRKNPWGGFREAWLEHYNHLNETVS